MRRLAAIDWLLLGISLPILLFGLVMSVVHGVRGDFVVPTFWATSAADEQSYPVVGRIWSRPSGEASPLAVGDRLVRLEESDLRGVSNAGFILRWSQAAQAGARSLLLTIDRGSVRSGVRVLLVPGYGPVGIAWWAPLPFIAGSVVTLVLPRSGALAPARRHYVKACSWCYRSGPRGGLRCFGQNSSPMLFSAGLRARPLEPQRVPPTPAIGSRTASASALRSAIGTFALISSCPM